MPLNSHSSQSSSDPSNITSTIPVISATTFEYWHAGAQTFHHLFTQDPQHNNLILYQRLSKHWPSFLDQPQEQAAQQLWASACQTFAETPLQVDHTQLFYGPGQPNAVPWGSVYLDNAQLVNGQSTMKLKAFYQQQQLVISQDQNRPLDHIGVFFATLSYCFAELSKEQFTQKPAPALLATTRALLSDYLLPWAFRFFELCQQHAQTDFYQAVAVLGRCYLQAIQQQWQLEVKPVKLYL